MLKKKKKDDSGLSTGEKWPERTGRPKVVGEKYNKLDLEHVEFEDQIKDIWKHFQECMTILSSDKIVTILSFIKHGANMLTLILCWTGAGTFK